MLRTVWSVSPVSAGQLACEKVPPAVGLPCHAFTHAGRRAGAGRRRHPARSPVAAGAVAATTRPGARFRTRPT